MALARQTRDDHIAEWTAGDHVSDKNWTYKAAKRRGILFKRFISDEISGKCSVGVDSRVYSIALLTQYKPSKTAKI